ncbi:MAG TPA: alpha/beta fold hydrolase [Casimicrobiaceae bacterium]|nr:alpha/beta fold hydrolase [Casimicrobiaceae bacterium]
MPTVRANGITIHYDVAGMGPPLVLIPFLGADCSCYAFQVPDYAKHFTCYSVDLRGAGGTDKPDGPYSTELFADDIAAFMTAAGVDRAHVAGMSLGSATATWLAAKYPARVRSLSLHSSWTIADRYLRDVLDGWCVMANALGSVTETVIRGILPWSFTPKLYTEKPEFIDLVADILRGGPQQPVEAFVRQAGAVSTHDGRPLYASVAVPTLITFGAEDRLTSTRFAPALQAGIRGSDLVVFDGCAHAPISEDPATFNRTTLEFLLRSH